MSFQRRSYTLIVTEHARGRMQRRKISLDELILLVETGKVKRKGSKGKFWVFREFESREDSFICASVSLEEPHLVVITTLVNWRPEDEN